MAKSKGKSTSKPEGKATSKPSLKLWLAGARLRTLPLAIAPVLIGMGAADAAGHFNLGLSLLALTVSLSLQIGVNYANDYSDGIRGTDAKRVGPLRLTGSNSVRPAAVKNAAFAFFGIAALAGLAIVLLTQHWWFLPVGAVSILAAWFYTGGKSPYGYAGLGELAVFVFFGLVATYGTAYIQIGSFDLNSLLGGVALGFFASAVLMINNIRDINTDAEVGKRTLAVKLGAKWAKVLYVLMLWLPMLILAPFPFIYPATFFAWATVFLSVPATVIALAAKSPREQILVLKLTSFAALAYAALFALGLGAING